MPPQQQLERSLISMVGITAEKLPIRDAAAVGSQLSDQLKQRRNGRGHALAPTRGFAILSI
jgi:hypothetical protein